MLGTVLISLVWVAMHIWGTSHTLIGLSFDDNDTAFLPRTVMVSSTLLFLMMLYYPDLPMQQKLFFINAYFIMYLCLFAMYMSQSPYLVVLGVFACFYAISQSIKLSKATPVPPQNNYAPVALGLTVFTLMCAFFSTGNTVDEYLNSTIKVDGIDDSALPESNIDRKPSIFGIEGFVPVVMGVFVYFLTKSAYSEQYKLHVTNKELV